MTVRELGTADELQYVEFAANVYAGVAAWVPPDAHHMAAQLSGQAFGGSHTRIQPFWVEDHGQILATCTGVIDTLFNAHWQEAVGHVLFFEALPGQQAASRAVLDATCDWLRQQGCRVARVGFLYGWQLPLTVDAHDEVPTTFHTLNPPYYHRYLKDAGFATESGQVEFIIDFTPELQARYEGMVETTVKRGVVMRPCNFADAAAEAVRFSRNYNATFGAHWGAPQFTVEDCEGLITGLRELHAEDLTAFADVDGETVGAVLALPDLNQMLHRLKTVADPNKGEVGNALAAIDHGALLSIGVLESARGTGLNLAMAARVYLAMMARGYGSASYTTVLAPHGREARRAHPPQLRRVSARTDTRDPVVALASAFGDVCIDLNRNAPAHAGRRRTLLLVRCERSLRGFSGTGWDTQRIAHPDPCDPRHSVDDFNVSFHVSAHGAVVNRDLAARQSAGQRAEQSSADGGDDVIERSWQILGRLDPVELLDAAVHAEPDWVRERLHVGVTNQPLDAVDSDAAGIDLIRHASQHIIRRSHPRQI
jgi:hypothetical protein